ncbi:hypothetical protein [Mariniluteicoccus flavus]
MSRTTDDELAREFHAQWHRLRNQTDGIELRSVDAEAGHLHVVYTRPGLDRVFGLRQSVLGADGEPAPLWAYLTVWDVIEPLGGAVPTVRGDVTWHGDIAEWAGVPWESRG